MRFQPLTTSLSFPFPLQQTAQLHRPQRAGHDPDHLGGGLAGLHQDGPLHLCLHAGGRGHHGAGLSPHRPRPHQRGRHAGRPPEEDHEQYSDAPRAAGWGPDVGRVLGIAAGGGARRSASTWKDERGVRGCCVSLGVLFYFKYFFGTRNLEQASPETFRIAPERKEGVVTWFWRRGVVCRTRKTKRRFHGFSSGS